MTIKRRARRLLAAALAAAMLLMVSGCFDRRELDTIAIVVGAGLDKGREEGNVRVTLQIANIGSSEQSDPQTASNEASSFVNVTEEGPAVNYAVRNMQSKVSRFIYLAHNKVIIIGEEMAKEGINDALDFFVRASEARLTVHLFVAEGEASEILDSSQHFGQLPGSEIQELIRKQEVTSTAPIVTEFDFVTTMIGKSREAYAPLIKIVEEDGGKNLKISGTAVFKDSKMVGTFDEYETQGMLHIHNRYKQGVLFVNIEDTPATIEILDAKTKIRPEVFTDGTIKMHIKLNVSAGLGDQGAGVNLFTPQNMDKVKSAVSDAIRDQIVRAIEKAKEYDSDVFGFGQSLSRIYPEKWKEIEGQWEDLFRSVQYDVEIKVATKLSGRTTTFLKPQ
jgi:spore germination protein KC